MIGLEACAAEEVEGVGMSVERLGWARDMLRRHVETGRSPSAAAVVVRRGELVLAEAFGVQQPDGDPLRIDHAWPIASAGKPLTAAVLLTLVEEGLVGINQPFVDYIPEMAGTGNDDVLIHHLLTHTAGWESALRTHRLEAVLAAGDLPPLPPGRDFISHLFLTLAFDPVKVGAPGVQMDYDNSHYDLLTEIIRRISGGTLDAAMRARVFEPLGMTRSAVIVDDALRSALVHRAPGLPFGADGPVSFEGELWESCDSGAAGVHMSPLDLAVFAQAILRGGEYDGARILAPSTVRSMVTNQIPGVPALFAGGVLQEGSWGYGFTVLREERFAYFSGGLVPFGSALHPGAGGISYWIDFEHEIVGVFFEVITKMTEFLEPISGIGHRFQDVITAAVIE
jgi:CubicO group peptidase (beta-lactamase class C family)